MAEVSVKTSWSRFFCHVADSSKRIKHNLLLTPVSKGYPTLCYQYLGSLDPGKNQEPFRVCWPKAVV